MANHSKAKHHHGKAGECLSKGDHKGAAHHMGHALSALRQSATDEPSGGAAFIDPKNPGYEPVAAKPKMGLRDRLKSFGKKK